MVRTVRAPHSDTGGVGAVIDRPRKHTKFQHEFRLYSTFSPEEMQIWNLPLPGAQ